MLGRYDGPIELSDGTIGVVQNVGESEELRFQDSKSVEDAIRETCVREDASGSVLIADGKAWTRQGKKSISLSVSGISGWSCPAHMTMQRAWR